MLVLQKDLAELEKPQRVLSPFNLKLFHVERQGLREVEKVILQETENLSIEGLHAAPMMVSVRRWGGHGELILLLNQIKRYGTLSTS